VIADLERSKEAACNQRIKRSLRTPLNFFAAFFLPSQLFTAHELAGRPATFGPGAFTAERGLEL